LFCGEFLMGAISRLKASKIQMALVLGLGLALSSCGLKPTILGNLSSSTNNVTQGGGSGGSGTPWAKQLGAVTAGGNASQYDNCSGVAVDGSGNVYCAGYTDSSLGEANGGSYDAYVMKLNSAGQVQWITQLGAVTAVPGGDTSHRDYCNGVAVDGNGNVYCAGQTFGSLGEVNGGNSDAFVMKLNSSGQVQWIRQLGAVTVGANALGYAQCYGVAVDGSGNVYCAGDTMGSVGEANGGGYDAFVLKLNSSGQVQWITQLGAVTVGAGASLDDRCDGVAVDGNGNVYCAGQTSGSLGEANGGNYDAFVLKLNSSGQVQWITQLGAVTAVPGGDTSQFDFCSGVAVDGSGNVYCAGQTWGSLGEANGGSFDAFVMKLDSSGTLQWIRQFGAVTKASATGDNSNWEGFYAIAVGSDGYVYAAGEADGDFAETEGGSNNGDAMVVKIAPDGTYSY
jgi:Tfp pilus assembly protein PilZ